MMSTLKNFAEMFVVSLVAICCCSCNESDSKVNDVFDETSSIIISETTTVSNVAYATSTVRKECSVTTTTTGVLTNTKVAENLLITEQNTQNTQITQPVQTTKVTPNTQTAQVTQTSNNGISATTAEELPKSTTNVPNSVEVDNGSQISLQNGFQYYKVQPGDSWSSIAVSFGVDKKLLAEANERTLDDFVFEGESLIIPSEFIDYTQQDSAESENYVQTQEQTQNNSGQFIGSSIVYSAPDSASWTNIAQAVTDINGLTLDPGEYFSWNSFVGWKTAQSVNPETGYNDWGYIEAPVIDGTEPGGGICVVSTALNKTARECGIYTIKYPHSRAVSYASGDDEAAVDYGSKDLQFSNPFNYPIVFYATCSYGSVSVSCYVA